MAWTAPRTFTTGETITAAILNTHVRDNFLQTAPAKVTTAGDLVYATGANALARLGVGAVNKILVGGASAPAWATTLGDASNNGELILKGADPVIQWDETDAADPDDHWQMFSLGSALVTRFRDESASVWLTSSRVDPGDFLLHTGNTGVGTGAVVIKTDTSGAGTAATTAGSTILSVSITTGGPAYVSGIWSAKVTRIATGAASDTISFLPRDDGSNLPSAFLRSEDWAENNIPGNGDIGVMTGIFYERFTSSNTSAWQMFVLASTNSIFTYNVRMMVTSIQYPT